MVELTYTLETGAAPGGLGVGVSLRIINPGWTLGLNYQARFYVDDVSVEFIGPPPVNVAPAG